MNVFKSEVEKRSKRELLEILSQDCATWHGRERRWNNTHGLQIV